MDAQPTPTTPTAAQRRYLDYVLEQEMRWCDAAIDGGDGPAGPAAVRQDADIPTGSADVDPRQIPARIRRFLTENEITWKDQKAGAALSRCIFDDTCLGRCWIRTDGSATCKGGTCAPSRNKSGVPIDVWGPQRGITVHRSHMRRTPDDISQESIPGVLSRYGTAVSETGSVAEAIEALGDPDLAEDMRRCAGFGILYGDPNPDGNGHDHETIRRFRCHCIAGCSGCRFTSSRQVIIETETYARKAVAKLPDGSPAPEILGITAHFFVKDLARYESNLRNALMPARGGLVRAFGNTRKKEQFTDDGRGWIQFGRPAPNGDPRQIQITIITIAADGGRALDGILRRSGAFHVQVHLRENIRKFVRPNTGDDVFSHGPLVRWMHWLQPRMGAVDPGCDPEWIAFVATAMRGQKMQISFGTETACCGKPDDADDTPESDDPEDDETAGGKSLLAETLRESREAAKLCKVCGREQEKIEVLPDWDAARDLGWSPDRSIGYGGVWIPLKDARARHLAAGGQPP